jgi:hypothetical protein
VEVHLGDVVELDLEHLSHARGPGAGASGAQIVDLEHGHVAALVASRTLELADGGASRGVPGIHGGDDLQKRVPDREHGVGQAEVGHGGVTVGLAEAVLPAQALDG